MIVVALVEYEVVDDDEYRYIERVEDEYECSAYSVWRTRFVHNLLARGIVVKSIKEISVEYVRD